METDEPSLNTAFLDDFLHAPTLNPPPKRQRVSGKEACVDDDPEDECDLGDGDHREKNDDEDDVDVDVDEEEEEEEAEEDGDNDNPNDSGVFSCVKCAKKQHVPSTFRGFEALRQHVRQAHPRLHSEVGRKK